MKSFYPLLLAWIAMVFLACPVHADTIPLTIADAKPAAPAWPEGRPAAADLMVVQSRLQDLSIDENDISGELLAMSAGDAAFYARHPEALQTVSGLTLDEFLYGTIMLAVVVAAVLIARARFQRHRD